MNRIYLASLISLILFAPLPAVAQKPKSSPAPSRPTSPTAKEATPTGATDKATAEAKDEAERVARVRREQARSLLLSLASDARSFRDPAARARTLARTADALWDTDLERGRELFRKAWEAAIVADLESDKKLAEEIRRQTAANGGYAFNLPPRLQNEVLKLTERRDPALAQNFRWDRAENRANQTDVMVRKAVESQASGNPPKIDPVKPGNSTPILQSYETNQSSLLDRLDHATDAAERDGIYFQLAFFAMNRGELQARDFVDKIDDTELRKAARPFVDANLVIAAIEKKQSDKALQLAQTGELTHIQRAWVMAQAAVLLGETDAPRALFVIEEAAAEARRIEGLDPDRPRALLTVANALLILDHNRAWDATFEVVKAANSAEGFTGEDATLNLQFRVKGSNAASTHAAPDLNLAGIFATLASEDYYRTVDLARGFQGEAPRAAAVIAIARAVLEEKRPQPRTPQPATKN